MEKQKPAAGVSSQDSPGVDFPGTPPPYLPLEAAATMTTHQREKRLEPVHMTPYQHTSEEVFATKGVALGRQLILGPGREIYKVSLEYPVVPKEVLTKMKTQKPLNDGGRPKELPVTKLEQFEQENKMVLDYKPKCKINTHKSILIKKKLTK